MSTTCSIVRGPGQRSVFRDVTHQHGGHRVLPREACEPRRALAHLRDRPRRAGQIGIEEGLHGVDREHVGPNRLDVGDHVRQRRLRRPARGRVRARRDVRRRPRTCSATPRRRRASSVNRTAARRPSAWSSNVDLPIPGSPPSSVQDPSVRPPPRTRSSSPIPVARRGNPTWATSAIGRAAPGCPGLTEARLATAETSESVPQASQSGQRPSQRGLSAPHASHRWIDLVFIGAACHPGTTPTPIWSIFPAVGRKIAQIGT